MKKLLFTTLAAFSTCSHAETHSYFSAFWPTAASRAAVATEFAAESRRDQLHCRS